MKNSGRRHFNRKVVALILALAMLFSQSALVYAVEGTAPVSANETVETPVQEPAGEEVTEPSNETPADEAANPADPAEETKPEEVSKPADEEPAASEETTVSEDEASASENDAEPEETVSEDEAETEEPAGISENGLSGNKVSDNTVSLSGGDIVVSINDVLTSVSEDLYYASGNTVSQPKAVKRMAGQVLGFDLKVVSLNGLSGNKMSGNVILTEGTDYKVTWKYKQKGWDVSENVTKDYKTAEPDPGTAWIIIEGISKNEAGKGWVGYKNTIIVTYNVEEKTVVPIGHDDLVVTPSYNRVTVSNNSKDKYMYVAVVSQNRPANLWAQGDYLAPGTRKVIYSYYYDTNKRTAITEKQPLTVVASYSAEFGADDAGTYRYNFTTTKNTGDAGGAPKDGYEEIKMKAVVNKAAQTIKISWSPAKSLGYKYYDLLRLGTNEETFTVVNKGEKITKTSYTYGKTEVERAAAPAVFKLICYDKNKAFRAEYITVAAPSLLYVEQGYDTNNLEYCFSKLYEDNDMAYRLELAEKNVENGKDEPGKRGFEQTKNKASVYYSTDMTEIKDFKVNNKVSVNALRDFFLGDADLKIEPGKTYYCRVKSSYTWHGKTYTSAPSNVVSRKAGPAKVYVFDINGLKYTKPAGSKSNKDAIEAANMSAMNDYLAYNFGLPGTQPLSSNCFIHRSNEGPDAKSGYVVFIADRISDNKLKGFELLRCDSQYGNYKKLKLYKIGSNDEPVKYSGLYKWQPADEEMKKLLDQSGVDIYYMHYNNFPPEKPLYYAVRGVYKKSNAVGGFGDGYECVTELDKVQNIYAFDGTIDKLKLYWRYDSCVKEYRLYRREFTKEDEAAGKNPSEFTRLGTNADDFKLVKKIKAKKTGTLKESSKKASDQELIVATSGNLIGDYVRYIDKNSKNNKIEEGHTYQYVVVPVYDTKKDSYSDYNMDKRSDVTYSMPTLAGAKIKNFKAANHGVRRIRISWSKLKGASAYLVIRTDKDPRESDDWKNIEGWVIDPTSTDPKMRTAYAKCAFVDHDVTVGKRYYYTIFAGSERSETITNGQVKYAKSLPLAVTDIKVENGSYRSGGKISWTKNPGDDGYTITYRVEYREASNGSSSYGGWTSLGTTQGTSWNDDRSLDRGVMRQYRVVSTYDKVAGGIREGGRVCTPTYLDISTGNTSMALGESMTVTVTPKRDGDPSSVTDVSMDRYEIGNNSVIEVTETKTEDGSVKYTIRAKGRGTSSFTVHAGEHNWTSNSSSSKLNKTINITVR
ncbi:MAG: hypothetical protein K6F86_09205 [Lachnospiraceae bacterium]|nr:hypothetical protein [Lachnospiraceae bacterium]